jgi:hypothetical protein
VKLTRLVTRDRTSLYHYQLTASRIGSIGTLTVLRLMATGTRDPIADRYLLY